MADRWIASYTARVVDTIDGTLGTSEYIELPSQRGRRRFLLRTPDDARLSGATVGDVIGTSDTQAIRGKTAVALLTGRRWFSDFEVNLALVRDEVTSTEFDTRQADDDPPVKR